MHCNHVLFIFVTDHTTHWRENYIPSRKPVFHVKYYITNTKQVSTSVQNIKLSLRVEIQLFWVFFCFVCECMCSFLRNSKKSSGSKLLFVFFSLICDYKLYRNALIHSSNFWYLISNYYISTLFISFFFEKKINSKHSEMLNLNCLLCK